MLDVSKEIEKVVNDDSFGLDPNEQVVCLLKKISKNQERMVELMVGVGEMLSNMRRHMLGLPGR